MDEGFPTQSIISCNNCKSLLQMKDEEGNGNPAQYTCLENHMVRGAWWATVHGIAKESDMT